MQSPIKLPAADSNAATSTLDHASPPLGLVAVIFTILFGAGLCFVVSFKTGEPFRAETIRVTPNTKRLAR